MEDKNVKIRMKKKLLKLIFKKKEDEIVTSSENSEHMKIRLMSVIENSAANSINYPINKH